MPRFYKYSCSRNYSFIMVQTQEATRIPPIEKGGITLEYSMQNTEFMGVSSRKCSVSREKQKCSFIFPPNKHTVQVGLASNYSSLLT